MTPYDAPYRWLLPVAVTALLAVGALAIGLTNGMFPAGTPEPNSVSAFVESILNIEWATTASIAAVGTIITIYNYKISSEKFKHDLHEKKMRCIEEVGEQIAKQIIPRGKTMADMEEEGFLRHREIARAHSIKSKYQIYFGSEVADLFGKIIFGAEFIDAEIAELYRLIENEMSKPGVKL